MLVLWACDMTQLKMDTATYLIFCRLLLAFLPELRCRDFVTVIYTLNFIGFLLLSEQLFIYLENTHGRAKAAPTTRSVSRTMQSPCSHSHPSIFATEEGSWALSRAVAIENNSRAGFQQPEKHNRNHQLERKRAHTVGIHRFKAVSYSNSWPSSVSKMNLSSSFEKEMRGSLSNSEGS